MPVFYAKRPSSGATLEPGENILVWFGNSTVEGCNNALLLAGGDLLLLKTIKRVSQDELDTLSEDYQKWVGTFGTGSASDDLRTALRQFKEVNSPGC